MSEPNQWDEAWMKEAEQERWRELQDEYDLHLRAVEDEERDRLTRDEGER